MTKKINVSLPLSTIYKTLFRPHMGPNKKGMGGPTKTPKINKRGRGDYYLKLESKYFFCGCLNNELRVNLYVRVTSYYSLHELQVKFIIRITNYYYELLQRVWDCNVDYVKFLYYTSYSFLWLSLYKIKYSSSATPEQSISWISVPTLNYNHLFSCVKLLYISVTYSLQHEVFLVATEP